MPDLIVEERPISALKPYHRNARKHSRKQIRQIADSIQTFGFNNPILLDGDNGIVAGHGRVEAAKLLGMERVPTMRLAQLTADQKRAYVIADNKIAENAGWDPEILAVELQHLLEVDLEFDVAVTGFDMAEIDLVIEGAAASDADQADDIPNIDAAASPVSRNSDLWHLGKHRLLCGDSRDAASFKRLLDSQLAQTTFLDPPYNVPINGHVSGLGSTKHREFPMASGEMSTTEFGAFLDRVLSHLIQFSRDGSIHFVCMDWRGSSTLLEAALPLYGELKNICVWTKTNAGMGSLYRSQHEFVFVFKNGSARHINNVELGRHGRHRSNVWTYPGANTFRDGRLKELALHPTPKPVQLVADALLDCSNRNGIVLDSFAGSGTTIIAAERTGRRCYAIELDPIYIDTAIRRWQDFTGGTATHVETGLTFAEMAERRSDIAPTEERASHG